MSSVRYKTLLAYLPGMAAVVNSFQSPEVQLSVYNNLMDALNEKESSEGKSTLTTAKGSTVHSRRVSVPQQESLLMHELVEGANIHTDLGDD